MIDLKIIFGAVLALGIGIGVIIIIQTNNSHVTAEDVESVPIELNPSVREEMFGPTESIQQQLQMYDESGRELFTPTESVKSQLKLP